MLRLTSRFVAALIFVTRSGVVPRMRAGARTYEHPASRAASATSFSSSLGGAGAGAVVAVAVAVAAGVVVVGVGVGGSVGVAVVGGVGAGGGGACDDVMRMTTATTPTTASPATAPMTAVFD